MIVAPSTIGQLTDQFGAMALKAPEFRGWDGVSDPEGHFQSTRDGLNLLKSKLHPQAYAYLLARLEENYARLISGDPVALRQLKLSFGEMAHFLSTKRYKADDPLASLTEHTEIRDWQTGDSLA